MSKEKTTYHFTNCPVSEETREERVKREHKFSEAIRKLNMESKKK